MRVHGERYVPLPGACTHPSVPGSASATRQQAQQEIFGFVALRLTDQDKFQWAV